MQSPILQLLAQKHNYDFAVTEDTKEDKEAHIGINLK